MGNLKELILHDCELENIGCLAGAQHLKKLILVRCFLNGQDLSALSQAPALKVSVSFAKYFSRFSTINPPSIFLHFTQFIT